MSSSEIHKIRSAFQDAVDSRASYNTINFESRAAGIDSKLDEYIHCVETEGREGWEEQVSFPLSLGSRGYTAAEICLMHLSGDAHERCFGDDISLASGRLPRLR